MNQQALGSLLADEAINRTAANNEEFVSEAVFAIRVLAATQDAFTTDDVWSMMEHHMVFSPATDPRAMGAAMRKAADERYIVPTGHYRKSTRAACHGRPLREWRAA